MHHLKSDVHGKHVLVWHESLSSSVTMEAFNSTDHNFLPGVCFSVFSMTLCLPASPSVSLGLLLRLRSGSQAWEFLDPELCALLSVVFQGLSSATCGVQTPICTRVPCNFQSLPRAHLWVADLCFPLEVPTWLNDVLPSLHLTPAWSFSVVS